MRFNIIAGIKCYITFVVYVFYTLVSGTIGALGAGRVGIE